MKKLLLSLLFAPSALAAAQAPEVVPDVKTVAAATDGNWTVATVSHKRVDGRDSIVVTRNFADGRPLYANGFTELNSFPCVPTCIALDKFGRAFVGGYSHDGTGSPESRDFLIFRLGPLGALEKLQKLDRWNSRDEIRSIAINDAHVSSMDDPSERIIIGGLTAGFFGNRINNDGFMMKFDTNLTPGWSKMFRQDVPASNWYEYGDFGFEQIMIDEVRGAAWAVGPNVGGSGGGGQQPVFARYSVTTGQLLGSSRADINYGPAGFHDPATNEALPLRAALDDRGNMWVAATVYDHASDKTLRALELLLVAPSGSTKIATYRTYTHRLSATSHETVADLDIDSSGSMFIVGTNQEGGNKLVLRKLSYNPSSGKVTPYFVRSDVPGKAVAVKSYSTTGGAVVLTNATLGDTPVIDLQSYAPDGRPIADYHTQFWSGRDDKAIDLLSGYDDSVLAVGNGLEGGRNEMRPLVVKYNHWTLGYRWYKYLSK